MSLKVVDHRLFTADGELRDEVKRELETPDAPAAPAPPPPVTPPVPEVTTDPAFLRLLDLLAQTASFYLSGMPDPATGRRSVDLNAVRQIIEALASLKGKTSGKLSFEEQNALDGILAEFQMAYAQLAASASGGPRKGGPPGRR